jgi:hypothetical protein
MAVHSILPVGVVPYRGNNKYRTATSKTDIAIRDTSENSKQQKNVNTALKICDVLLKWFWI